MSKKELSIYIHIPFCKKKCNYCDFLSFEGCSERQKEEYITALCKEMELYREDAASYCVKTIFIGGGTPSLLQPEVVDILFSKIYSIWNVDEQAEITMETNPGTLTRQRLMLYRTVGINRLSIGLQTTEDSLLKTLGRIHNYDQFLKTYQLARTCGFENINIDIMAALPGQSLKEYEESLYQVAQLKPEHISAYSLIIEEGTEFAKNMSLQSFLPDEDIERDMYLRTKQILQEYGYERYEISNYAKRGYECKHNIVYWTTKEYLGIGLGAASYYKGIRFSNERNLNHYYNKLNNQQSFRIEENQLTRKEQIEEFMFLGLRLIHGVSAETFSNRFGVDMWILYGNIIDRFISMKMLYKTNDGIALTDKGLSVSNQILAEFLLEEV